ncbi:MAG: tetraacyldisaccharide 4'-kinase [Candidatus Gastranaerophilales bacterium]|nr:tetraacyldisaccharide 4'-kinase [Candidatus Gastranaerophilales bacterium]
MCVGNLTTGGVGKTPVVIEIANYLAKKNRVAVLSRGYGGKLDKKLVNLIRTYDEILIDDAKLTGDEVNLIAKRAENFCVITSKDRIKAVQFAKEKLNADIIVMDDGFSNRKIYKDLNLILIDTKKKFGTGCYLPLGPLREPVLELCRADRIIFTDKNSSKIPVEIANKYNLPYTVCKMIPEKIYNIKTGEILQKNIKVAAFCGIGSPEQFYAQLSGLGYDVIKEYSFDDHVEYNQKIIDEMLENLTALPFITTEKDAVKLKNLKNTENIYALELKPDLNLEEIFNNGDMKKPKK